MPQDSTPQTTIPRRITIVESEAAEYIGMSIAFLRSARMGRGTPGPVFVRMGRAIRYRITDLDKWMDQHAEGAPRERKARRR